MARIVLLLALGCAAAVNAAEPLRIAVAGSFQPAMQRLVPIFERSTGTRVQWQVGSSGALYQHIRMGAGFDLFLSADRKRPQGLEHDGFAMPGSRETYALGRLVWWQPGRRQSSAPDLSQFTGRLAMANPRLAPYGAAAEAVIAHLGGRAALSREPALAPNIAQAYQFVASGNAAAGLLALAQLKAFHVDDGVWMVPVEWYPRICQQSVVLKSPRASLAARFQRFLTSAATRKTIRDLGYAVPGDGQKRTADGC